MRGGALDELRAYGASLERTVPESVARRAAFRALVARPRRAVGRRSLAAAVGMVTLLSANAALAAVANGAVPGDPLYGVDRAYERVGALVGLGHDHAAERLDEATVLVGRGRYGDAVGLVAEAMREAGGDAADPALAALIDAAEPGVGRDGALALVAAGRGVASAARDGSAEALDEALRSMRETLGGVLAVPSGGAGVGTGKPADTPGYGGVGSGKPADTPGNGGVGSGKPADTPGNGGVGSGKPADTPGNGGAGTGKPADAPGEGPTSTPGTTVAGTGAPGENGGVGSGKPADTPGNGGAGTGKPAGTPGNGAAGTGGPAGSRGSAP